MSHGDPATTTGRASGWHPCRTLPPAVVGDTVNVRVDGVIATQVRLRKLISNTTFGIEVRGLSVILESDWHRAAQLIDPRITTGHPLLDEFFLTRFSPMTTRWVHEHPEIDKVRRAFDRYVIIMNGAFDFTRPIYAEKTMRKVPS